MFMAPVNPGLLSLLTTVEMDGHFSVDSFNNTSGKLRMRGVLNLTFPTTTSGTITQVICIGTFPLSYLAKLRLFIYLFIFLIFQFNQIDLIGSSSLYYVLSGSLEPCGPVIS